MRAPVYLVCAATLMSALSGRAHPQPDSSDTARMASAQQRGAYYDAQGAEGEPSAQGGSGGRLLEPLNMEADPETVEYLLPRLTAKYRPNNEWTGVTDPRFYLLTEMEGNDMDNQNYLNPEYRNKRAGRLGEGASLSIVNSLDVLRNRLLLEIARKKAKEGANRNRQMLLNLGKRAFYHRNSIYNNKA